MFGTRNFDTIEGVKGRINEGSEEVLEIEKALCTSNCENNGDVHLKRTFFNYEARDASPFAVVANGNQTRNFQTAENSSLSKENLDINNELLVDGGGRYAHVELNSGSLESVSTVRTEILQNPKHRRNESLDSTKSHSSEESTVTEITR